MGTEINRSPEMLTTSQGRAVQHGAGHVAGSSYPSDVWALGCLLYELLTQQLLFQEYGNNYPKFHAVVTGVLDEVPSCSAASNDCHAASKSLVQIARD